MRGFYSADYGIAVANGKPTKPGETRKLWVSGLPVIRVLDHKIPSRPFNSHGKSPVTGQQSEPSSLPFTAPCCIRLINRAVTFSSAHNVLRRRHGTAGDKEGGRSRVRPPGTSPRQEPITKTGCIVGTRWDSHPHSPRTTQGSSQYACTCHTTR